MRYLANRDTKEIHCASPEKHSQQCNVPLDVVRGAHLSPYPNWILGRILDSFLAKGYTFCPYCFAEESKK
jgi:hypothetical protein